MGIVRGGVRRDGAFAMPRARHGQRERGMRKSLGRSDRECCRKYVLASSMVKTDST